MRPRLKAGVEFASSSDELLVRDRLRTVTIRGSGAYEVMVRLAPFLDGSLTAQQITSGMSKDKREAVIQLLEMLHDRGFVRDLNGATKHNLSSSELEEYSSQIAFIDALCDSAEYRFEQYRRLRVLAIGPRGLVEPLTDVLLGSGVQTVRASEQSDRRDFLEVRPVWGPASTPRAFLGTGGPDEALLDPLKEADAVVHLAQQGWQGAFEMARLCRDLHKDLIQAVVLDEEAWFGSASSRDGGESAGVTAAWRRVVVPSGESGWRANAPPSISKALEQAVPQLMAALACFHLFRLVVGLESPAFRVARLDLRTCEVTHHSYVPHPLSLPDHAREVVDAVPDVHMSDQGHTATDETLLRAMDEIVDPRIGVVLSIGESNLAQLPLAVTEAVVSDPRFHPPGVFGSVFGVGDDWREARVDGMRKALEAYCSRAFDPRRILRRSGLATRGADPMSLEEMGMITPDGWLDCHRVPDSAPFLIRAATAFPVGAAPQASWTGVASDRSGRAAVEKALVRALLHMVIKRGPRGGPEWTRIDLGSVPADVRLQRYLALVLSLDDRLGLHGLHLDGGVQVLAFSLGSRTIAYSADCSSIQALQKGLQTTLLALQARLHHQPIYAPTQVPPLPPVREPDQPLSGWQWDRTSGDSISRTVTAALEEEGLLAVAIAQDHDPAVSRLLGHVSRVVIAHADSGFFSAIA
jgi:hypothetical protein